jgi:hypothetical protein
MRLGNLSNFKAMASLSAALLVVLAGSCTKLEGYGVLLWSSEDPPVPSGTVLPVYIKSNINEVWVAGIPEEYRGEVEGVKDKFEIPLKQMEVFHSKRAAEKRAAEFAPLALAYGETLQDGLPIRDTSDNSGRRVYRLRKGEVVKLLAEVPGTPAISSTGDPLPGAWYQVLTSDGSTGYCFSYRLRIFDYSGGTMRIAQSQEEAAEDAELETVLDKTWSPESYAAMLADNKIDAALLQEHWGFFPGEDEGSARIFLKDIENDRVINETFAYTAIVPAGTSAWRFEGSSLQMQLRANGTLAVQYTEDGKGAIRTYLFMELPTSVDDLILQETARRQRLFSLIYGQGPLFSSANYGALTLNRNASFVWTGFDLLVPHVIPASARGNGRVNMGIFLDPQFEDQYAGAFTLRFNAENGSESVSFLYNFEQDGLRIEYISDACFDGVTVVRREASPTVIYFSKGGTPGAAPDVEQAEPAAEPADSAIPQEPAPPDTAAPQPPAEEPDGAEPPPADGSAEPQ